MGKDPQHFLCLWKYKETGCKVSLLPSILISLLDLSRNSFKSQVKTFGSLSKFIFFLFFVIQIIFFRKLLCISFQLFHYEFTSSLPRMELFSPNLKFLLSIPLINYFIRAPCPDVPDSPQLKLGVTPEPGFPDPSSFTESCCLSVCNEWHPLDCHSYWSKSGLSWGKWQVAESWETCFLVF